MSEPTSNNQLQELILLNIGILVISTTGVLGRYITIPSVAIIMWRSMVGVFVLLPLVYYYRSGPLINWKKDGVKVIFSSLMIGGHWITYFYALEVSNIAIAVLSLASNIAITAILEPFILKSKFNKLDLLLGPIILIGIYIMSPAQMDFSNHLFQGILLGVLSAFCYSLRNIVTKDLVKVYDSRLLMLTQIAIVLILLLPFPPVYEVMPTSNEWLAIIALGVGASAVGHTLYARGLRSFNASSVAVAASIIPVYAIFWGYLFLNEAPRPQTIIGGTVIVMVVLIRNLYHWRTYKASTLSH